MIELKGTEKQVKWAEEIRDKWINKLKKLTVEDELYKYIRFFIGEINEVIDFIEKIEYASTFIDNRKFIEEGYFIDSRYAKELSAFTYSTGGEKGELKRFTAKDVYSFSKDIKEFFNDNNNDILYVLVNYNDKTYKMNKDKEELENYEILCTIKREELKGMINKIFTKKIGEGIK